MRILYLRNTGFQCDPHVESIKEVAWNHIWDLQIFDYYTDNHDEKILNAVRTFMPTHVIWLGVCGGPYEPEPETFTKIRQLAKTIALVPEASHPDWGKLIDRFYDHGSFDLIVNLDGNKRWASQQEGLTTLAIYGTRAYAKEQLEWYKRPIDLGWCGGSGSPGTLRHAVVEYLKASTKVKFVELPFVDEPGTYQKYADFMMNCKMVVNASGSAGDSSYHVKGRVIEAGLAGCCLFEDYNSPIEEWFDSTCYWRYSTPDEIEDLAEGCLSTEYPKYAIEKAWNLQREVQENHSPEVIWGKIFDIVGGK